MLFSEPFVRTNILLACDALDAKKQNVTVETVSRWLVKDWGYEYPRDMIEKTIAERDLYVWNVKTHGYEKAQL